MALKYLLQLLIVEIEPGSRAPEAVLTMRAGADATSRSLSPSSVATK
jgi:hypothetical protein